MSQVSLIIPVKNEARNIAALLDSVKAQTRQPDEIVIVDGGSADDTVAIIERYRAERMPIKLLTVQDALPGRGRNIAIQNAGNDIIAMTDGGIILDRKWLEALIAPFDRSADVDVVYGAWEGGAQTLFEECFCIVYIPSPKKVGTHLINYPFIASSAIRKKVWERIGGFREDIRATEDMLFMREVQAGGFRCEVAPEAMVYWRPRKDLAETFKLSFRYAICDAKTGFFALRFFRKYLILAIAGYILLLSMKSHAWLLVLLCGALVNALLVCSKHWQKATALIKKRPAAFFYLIAIVATLDIGGMIGFAIGKTDKMVKQFFHQKGA